MLFYLIVLNITLTFVVISEGLVVYVCWPVSLTGENLYL